MSRNAKPYINLKHYNGNTENRCKTNHFEREPYNGIGMQWKLEQWIVKLNIKSKPYATLKAWSCNCKPSNGIKPFNENGTL